MRQHEPALTIALLVLAAGAATSCSSANDATSDPTNGQGGAFPLSSGGLGAVLGGGGQSAGGRANGGGNTASGGTSATGTGGSAAGTSNDSGGASPEAGGSNPCIPSDGTSVNDATTGTNDGQFDYAGAWSTSAAPEKFQGDDHYASATDASVTLHFQGTSAALHSATAPHHGIAVITVDGGSPADVDLYAAGRADDVEVWKSGALAAGAHTLVVRVSGRKNAASTGTTVAVDRVVVGATSCAAGSGGASAGNGGASTSGGAPGSGGAESGGTPGSGGAASGGMPGSGGASGVQRPSYNTGPGFFVVGSKLYDANGAEFRIRGVNKLHWDASSPGIPKTHANTERWTIDFTRAATSNVSLVQGSIDNHIVPMPGNWNGTCKEDTSVLTGIVDTWVAQVEAWKTLDKYMILNIANEWGPSSTAWRDAYITAIGRLRAAGYRCTISVTSGGCGQDNADLAGYAKAVFDSDPQKNVIFDQHVYGNWSNGSGQSWQTDLKTGLAAMVSTGLPMIVGEFGPGRSVGPSPTTITPDAVMEECEKRGIGWLAWAWDDPASNADDGWFALSKNGSYDSTNDLTLFGKSVVENPTYGLLKVAKPATVF